MLNIYNTMTRRKEEFRPLKEGRVSMYVCGPTVYDVPHIGHMRSAWVFDMFRKYLCFSGFEVEFVRNVTDIDDKIIDRAIADIGREREDIGPEILSKAVEEVAGKYLSIYHDRLEQMGIEPPTHEPRATSCVEQIIDYIGLLKDKEYAYVSGENVYFSVEKFKGYGRLSNRRTEDLMQGVRIEKDENKEHPLDFALWKAAKPGEPFWESPWGRGRPGWHIECSAMSNFILGEQFDIHGGGLDLIFPHHENEIAQSEAATGKTFARYWVHNGLLTVRGEKMSKSLGNYITIDDFLEEFKYPDILKIAFAFSHYRSPTDYSDEKIQEASRCRERMLLFLERSGKFISEKAKEGSCGRSYELCRRSRKEFKEAMDDDLNTPQAMSVMFKVLKKGNEMLSSSSQNSDEDISRIIAIKKFLEESSGIMGFSLESKPEKTVDEKLVNDLVEKRQKAREEKNFDEADKIRDKLLDMGILVEDTPGGSEWRTK